MAQSAKSHLVALVAAFACLALTAEARLKILSPHSLAQQFQNSTIRANYANFGFIPYGQTIMGKLHYFEEHEKACEEIEEEKVVLERTDDVTPFMIAYRGDCSFVQKVRNMENIGVAVSIIIDNRPEMIDEILMSDDGTGGGIRIPSMLIGENDGKKLIEWYKNASDKERKSLVMMSEFIMPVHENVTVDFWFTSSSDRAVDFLEDFKKIEKQLGDKMRFRPRYVFWECTNCDQKYLENDCFGGGKYCAVESSNSNIKGQDIVLEDLRQICLWNQFNDAGQQLKWWRYMQQVHSTCYSIINEDCSMRAHEHLDLDFSKTQDCVKDSFYGIEQTKWAEPTTRNKYIDVEIGYWKDFGTNIYPSIVINQKTYRGQIEPLSVFNAICAGYSYTPDVCLKTMHKERVVLRTKVEEGSVSTLLIVVIVLALIAVNVLIVYCCRRKAKRDMNNEMQMQIESAVSQYFALTNKDETTRSSRV